MLTLTFAMLADLELLLPPPQLRRTMAAATRKEIRAKQ
jgi:hypothetical protein